MRDFLSPTIPFLLRFRAPSKAQRPSLHSSQAGARGSRWIGHPISDPSFPTPPPTKPICSTFWGVCKVVDWDTILQQKPSPLTSGNVIFYKDPGLENAFLSFFRDPYARLPSPNHSFPSAIPGAFESTET